MKWLFEPPTLDDVVRLLRAWRFWFLGSMLGALVGMAAYSIFPPQYRARATVNVDFNLEQAWPQDTDRQQFYYLEREARKLEEIAWHDEVMNQLALEFSVPVEELRGGKLQLSQPAEAGWHFFAEDDNAQQAVSLASAWAKAFVQHVRSEIEAGNLNEYIRLEVTQSEHLPRERRAALGEYLLAGSVVFLLVAVFYVLMIGRQWR
jgi:pimeloyl-ACP methyl ester carboxylesterase